jgi:hypothetical protein
MANESSAVLGGVVGGLVFIGIAILVGDHFYEQCVDDWLDDDNCLGDDWYLKDGECCTTRYSWQAWCCGLPFALVGISLIGGALSAKEKNASEGQNSVSIKKEGNDVENTREKYDLGEEYSDEDIALVNQWKNENMEEEPEPPKAEPKKAVKKKVVRKSVSKKVVRKAAPPSDGSENSLADELKKLNELKEQGIIDEKEFKTAKKKLLEQ